MNRKAIRFLTAFISISTILFQCVLPVKAHERHDTRVTKANVKKHWQDDFGYEGFKELNQQLQRDFLSFDNAENLEKAAFAQSMPAAENAHLVGSWSPVFDLPIVPIHVMVLTNGKVLMWDSVGDNPTETYPVHDFTRAAIWDPATNIVTRVDNNTTGYNMFCAGFAHLPNGTPFIAGGNLDQYFGGTDTIHFFNQLNNSWSLGPRMTQGGRWYPSVTPLASGEMLITSGYIATPEVYTTSGTLRTLSSATLAMPLYPWLQAVPNGQAFYFGPGDTMRYLNTNGTGSWTNLGTRGDGIFRDYGSFAMYDIGRILASGGSNSTKKSIVIDVTNPNVNPVIGGPSDMNFGRRQHNLTVLPDGTILATGGNSSGASLIDQNANVFDAELWNPSTGSWRVLSRAEKKRQYHSAAILLPDGRVFTGGGGICGACAAVNYLEKNMEVFTPPYLYRQDGSGELAPRPSITNAPDIVTYNKSFTIETPQANDIQQAVMMRVSSVTHSIDFEQRRIPLQYSVNGNGLTAVAPANSNIAPPGYYMLFLIDGAGVPSVAKIMKVDYGTNLGAPVIVASSGGGGSANLSWIPVYGATDYQIKYGTTSENYTNTVNTGNVTQFSVSGLTSARHYFVVKAINPTISGDDSNEVSITPNTASAIGNGLTATYYNSLNFTNPALTRIDPQINFSWLNSSPANEVGADDFTVRWTGKIEPQTSGTYIFYTTSDDGVRLWVNNQLIIDNWTNHGDTEDRGTIALQGGQQYDIKMEFYEREGYATAKLEWSSTLTARQFIPQFRLFSAAPTASGVVVSGRVTSPLGTGLSNVRVMLTGGNLSEPIYAQTNPFGYYQFDDVTAGENYVITVSSKQHNFAQSSLLLNVTGYVTDADFTSDW